MQPPARGRLVLWLEAAALAGVFLLLLARSSPELAMVVLMAYGIMAFGLFGSGASPEPPHEPR